MGSEGEPLEDLADAILEGGSVDWRSAESSAGAADLEALRQLRVVENITRLSRDLVQEVREPAGSGVPEEKLERWGRLEILERIGRGSFGEVYRARDPKLDREVAVKLLRADRAQPEGAAVLQEARLLARVRHPNVVTVYDADEIDGRVGLWMEFIHGRHLEQVLAERKKLDGHEVAWIGIELCRALAAVHEAGLLHRDIKAQNVMETGDGRLVLMDFGTGRESGNGPTSAVDAAGTPLYLAPEVFEGAPATVASDVYSAGVLLFHLLTGSYPVRGATVLEVTESHARGRRLDLSASAPGIDRRLVAAIERAIDRDPARRYESAREMLAALEKVRARAEARKRTRYWIAAGAAGIIAIALAVTPSVRRTRRDANPSSPAAGTPPVLRPQDSVLVAAFENRTGEKVLDGSLEYALSVELSNSRVIRVATRERIGDALKLMRKPSDSVIDTALGREVCLRDGGIRAVVTGRIEKPGPKYLLSVELIEPKDGAVLAGFLEESASTEGALAAVQRVSDRVRSAVGEQRSGGGGDGPPLLKVTTRSLRALQLFSRADNLMREKGNLAFAGNLQEFWTTVEALLREAVAEDPSFASAWLWLACSLSNQAHAFNKQDKRYVEALSCAETALRLADTTTDRERGFILGVYYDLHGERQKAIAAFEKLLAVYPDHQWAAENLTHLYDFSHDPHQRIKAVQAEAMLADARPKDFFWNSSAAFDYIAVTPDPVRAAIYRRRSLELVTPEIRETFPVPVSYLDVLPFAETWLKGDLPAAAAELDNVAARIDPLEGRARDCLATDVALAYLTLGRLETAARISEKILDPIARGAMLTQVDFLREDARALRRDLESAIGRHSANVANGFWDTTLILEARAGLLSGREPNIIQDVVDGGERLLPEMRGEFALAHGHPGEAIPELEDYFKSFGVGPYGPTRYLSAESLAAALAQQGDLPRAIQILEQNDERRDAALGAYGGTTAAYWFRNRLQLAQLYRRSGRVEEARAVEADLSRTLALADPDHPIVRELARLRNS